MSASKSSIAGRFRQGVLIGLGLGVVVYVAYALYVGWDEVAGALARFDWRWLPALLALSLANYGARFLRWEIFLRMLDIRVPLTTSFAIFLSGLAMTITPGKVGEFIKSYLLKESHGIPMARSAPVVFVERVGDLLALLLLASFGVASYAASAEELGIPVVPLLVGAGVAVGSAVLVLQSKGLTDLALGLVAKVPIGNKIAPKIAEAVDASRALLSWKSLVIGLGLASVAWLFECLEYWLAFRGFGIDDFELGLGVFAYSFSTVAGVVSPGGIGPTDVGLIEIAVYANETLGRDTATAASFIVRVCTLWFAVLLGAIALLRFRSFVEADVETARAGAVSESDTESGR